MARSKHVRMQRRKAHLVQFDGLTDRQRTTIVAALRFFEEGWAKEVHNAAEDCRPPAFHSRGQILEEHDLLTPAQMRELCEQIASQSSVLGRNGSPTPSPQKLVTFAIPCVKCHVPMQPQPRTVTGDKTGRTRTVPVLACPNCGETAESCEQATAGHEN